MDIQALTIFLTVAEELHFGRAGQRLLFPQPHVSRSVGNLEKELGVKLFQRTTRQVKLTSAGHALVVAARRIVAATEAARLEVRAAECGEGGRVSISFSGPSFHTAVGVLARAVRSRYPKIELDFRPGRYGRETFDEVLDGTTDLSMSRFRSTPLGIAQRPIGVEHYIVAVSSDHRLASESVVSMDALRSELFVSLPPGTESMVRSDFVELCHNAGFAPNITQTAPDTWTILALVAAGVGATFTVDTALVHDPAGIHALRISEAAAPTYASLAWREDSTNAALTRVLEVSEAVLPTPPEVDTSM